MSARPMVKRCIHCHRTYNYNPSVGDFGAVCRHCPKIQMIKSVGIKLTKKK